MKTADRRSVLVALRLTPREVARMRALAMQRGVTVSALIRNAVLGGPRALERRQ